jgi:hypothetical protein
LNEWIRGGGLKSVPAAAATGTLLAPGLLFLFGASMVGAGVRVGLTPREDFATSFVLASILLSVGLVTSVLTATWALRGMASPLVPATLFHPLYLLMSQPKGVTVYPLLAMSSVQATHHHTNGAYTGTVFSFVFGDASFRKPVTVNIRGKDKAEQFMGAVNSFRRRALELLMDGTLDADDHIDLLPPKLLQPRGAGAPNIARGSAPWPALVAALVAALVLGAGVAYKSLYDAQATVAAAAFAPGHVGGVQGYLAANPGSRFAGAARASIASRLSKADSEAAFLKKTGHAGAPDLIAVLAAMRAKERCGVVIEFVGGAENSHLARNAIERAVSNGFAECFTQQETAAVSLKVAPGAAVPVEYKHGDRLLKAEARSLVLTWAERESGKVIATRTIAEELPLNVIGGAEALTQVTFNPAVSAERLSWALGTNYGMFASATGGYSLLEKDKPSQPASNEFGSEDSE